MSIPDNRDSSSSSSSNSFRMPWDLGSQDDEDKEKGRIGTAHQKEKHQEGALYVVEQLGRKQYEERGINGQLAPVKRNNNNSKNDTNEQEKKVFPSRLQPLTAPPLKKTEDTHEDDGAAIAAAGGKRAHYMDAGRQIEVLRQDLQEMKKELAALELEQTMLQESQMAAAREKLRQKKRSDLARRLLEAQRLQIVLQRKLEEEEEKKAKVVVFKAKMQKAAEKALRRSNLRRELLYKGLSTGGGPHHAVGEREEEEDDALLVKHRTGGDDGGGLGDDGWSGQFVTGQLPPFRHESSERMSVGSAASGGAALGGGLGGFPSVLRATRDHSPAAATTSYSSEGNMSETTMLMATAPPFQSTGYSERLQLERHRLKKHMEDLRAQHSESIKIAALRAAAGATASLGNSNTTSATTPISSGCGGTTGVSGGGTLQNGNIHGNGVKNNNDINNSAQQQQQQFLAQYKSLYASMVTGVPLARGAAGPSTFQQPTKTSLLSSPGVEAQTWGKPTADDDKKSATDAEQETKVEDKQETGSTTTEKEGTTKDSKEHQLHRVMLLEERRHILQKIGSVPKEVHKAMREELRELLLEDGQRIEDVLPERPKPAPTVLKTFKCSLPEVEEQLKELERLEEEEAKEKEKIEAGTVLKNDTMTNGIVLRDNAEENLKAYRTAHDKTTTTEQGGGKRPTISFVGGGNGGGESGDFSGGDDGGGGGTDTSHYLTSQMSDRAGADMETPRSGPRITNSSFGARRGLGISTHQEQGDSTPPSAGAPLLTPMSRSVQQLRGATQASRKQPKQFHKQPQQRVSKDVGSNSGATAQEQLSLLQAQEQQKFATKLRQERKALQTMKEKLREMETELLEQQHQTASLHHLEQQQQQQTIPPLQRIDSQNYWVEPEHFRGGPIRPVPAAPVAASPSSATATQDVVRKEAESIPAAGSEVEEEEHHPGEDHPSATNEEEEEVVGEEELKAATIKEEEEGPATRKEEVRADGATSPSKSMKVAAAATTIQSHVRRHQAAGAVASRRERLKEELLTEVRQEETDKEEKLTSSSSSPPLPAGEDEEPTIMIDHQGIILQVTQTAAALFGYSSCEELSDRNVKMIMPVEIARRHDQYLVAYARTGIKSVIDTTRVVTGFKKDGSLIEVELSVKEERQQRNQQMENAKITTVFVAHFRSREEPPQRATAAVGTNMESDKKEDRNDDDDDDDDDDEESLEKLLQAQEEELTMLQEQVAVKNKQHEAATVVQREWRRYGAVHEKDRRIEVKRDDEHKQQEYDAAWMIQGLYRQKKARAQIQLRRSLISRYEDRCREQAQDSKNNTTSKNRRSTRGITTRVTGVAEIAARAVQCLVRRRRAKGELNQRRAAVKANAEVIVRQEAATLVQQHVRGMLSRRARKKNPATS